MSEAIRRFDIVQRSPLGEEARTEAVAHEEPLELQVNGVALAVLMRTPGHDEDLARGFLLTERIVSSNDDIVSLRHCTTAPDTDADENVMQARLSASVRFDPERLRRHSFASSSCGICGKATIENACALAPPLQDATRIEASVLSAAPAKLLAEQAAFALTGGLHGAALFSLAGDLVVAREDVGRHNAVDKVLGQLVERGLPPRAHVVFVSGRISFELVQKVAAVGVPILAGISAPTSLAVTMGRAARVTVIGFVRGAAMNVYAAPERVLGTPSS